MKPRIALVPLSLWFLVACQVVFGDFKIDTSYLATPCEIGAARCDGSHFEVCGNGKQWDTKATCDSPEACNVLTGGCAACETGAYQCNDVQPQKCNGHGWENLPVTCASATLCTVPEDGDPAFCRAPGCTAGSYQCDGDTLQRCPLSQVAWQDVETCATGTCDADAANHQAANGQPVTCKGACTDPAKCPQCTPGVVNCVASELQRCRSDGNLLDKEQCSNGLLCDPTEAHCLAPRCEAKATRCVGAVAQICRGDLTGWEQCSMDACVKACTASCTAGTYRCNDVDLELCDATGRWASVQRCDSAALCSATDKACTKAVCAMGDLHCAGNVSQMCSDGLDAWTNHETCGTGTVCNAPAKKCPAN